VATRTLTDLEPRRERPGRVRGRGRLRPVLSLLLGLLAGAPAVGEEAVVVVAANFSEVADRLEGLFEAGSEHSVTFVVGSTGKLYAQIVHGAPFDAFLAADQERPKRLESEGLAVAGSRFTYAVGRLALWSRDPGRIGDDGASTLRQGEFHLLAIANPALAPYGEAARQALARLHLWAGLQGRIVMGETIGQAHALVASGNADLGLVALSYVLSPRNGVAGSRWDVPPELYAPIRQDAVLLTRAAGNEAAREFLSFLRSKRARDVIETYGYGTE